MILVELEASNKLQLRRIIASVIESRVVAVLIPIFHGWHHEREEQRALALLDDHHTLDSVRICSWVKTTESTPAQLIISPIKRLILAAAVISGLTAT